MSRLAVAPLVLSLLLMAASGLSALSVEEVGNELVCLCGCGLVLNNCNHTDCGFALPARKLIAEQIAQGMTKEQIIASFASEYGEVVLASPTRKGFNLTVWILPFGAILVGAAGLGLLLYVWVRRRRLILLRARSHLKAAGRTPNRPVGASRAADERYERIFKKELEKFE